MEIHHYSLWWISITQLWWISITHATITCTRLWRCLNQNYPCKTQDYPKNDHTSLSTTYSPPQKSFFHENLLEGFWELTDFREQKHTPGSSMTESWHKTTDTRLKFWQGALAVQSSRCQHLSRKKLNQWDQKKIIFWIQREIHAGIRVDPATVMDIHPKLLVMDIHAPSRLHMEQFDIGKYSL